MIILGVLTLGRQTLAASLEITLDAQAEGRTFEGLGALSAGASSRLLIDYPEPQRSQILDYLFKPNYGASLHHLKVEIGGGINSTDGAEPSHMRTRTDENYTRGYEWWLMKEAKQRNPAIILDCLAWGAPGWIGNGNFFSPDMADYVVKFLKGAKATQGLDINYTGIWNERAYDTNWIVSLRNALDGNGLSSVKIVAADRVRNWKIADEMLANPGLYAAVDRVGTHYVRFQSTAAAKALGKPIWSSEDGPWGGTWDDAQSLARSFNRNYIEALATKTITWSLVSSYYNNLAIPDSGPMLAREPWSGHYEVQPAVWAFAHTTQFAQPGWKYLAGGACALLPGNGITNGGSIVTLKSTNHWDYAIVVETSQAPGPHTITFHLTNGLSPGLVHVWSSSATQQFVEAAPIMPLNGTFICTFQPEAIYTLSTTIAQRKGNATPPPPASMALPFRDDFESYGDGKTPRFFSDQAGTFETVERADGQGKSLRQVLSQPGIRWVDEWAPQSAFGDGTWTDYEVSSDVLLESNGFALLHGRVSKYSGYTTNPPTSYWLAASNAPAGWGLYYGSTALASGSIPFPTNVWHNLRLAMQAQFISGFVDGVKVVSLTNSSSLGGMSGLGCGWHGAQFDNFIVRRLHRAGMPLTIGATATASSVWSSDYKADLANDGNFSTRWNSANGSSNNEWLALDFLAPVSFNRTALSQFMDRITAYRIQYWTAAGWSNVIVGGRLGPAKTDTFATVTSSQVRFYIDTSTQSSSIYEFQVFFDAPAPSPVRINEWMVNNTHAIADPANGQFNSWFELYNPATTNFDLTGFYLSGSPSNRFQFAVPSGCSVPAGGCLLVWADGKPELNAPGQPDLHVNFTLAQSQVIQLCRGDGQPADTVDLDFQPPDSSSGSVPDGDAAVVPLAVPSPRSSNNRLGPISSGRPDPNGNITLSFVGFPFQTHRIQSADNLTTLAWTNSVVAKADALGSVRFTAPTAGRAQRFYRAVYP